MRVRKVKCNATKEYGIDYNSHPTGLSFYYQYIPYDNDQTDIFIQIWSDETLLGEGTFKQGNTINNLNRLGYDKYKDKRNEFIRD